MPDFSAFFDSIPDAISGTEEVSQLLQGSRGFFQGDDRIIPVGSVDDFRVEVALEQTVITPTSNTPPQWWDKILSRKKVQRGFFDLTGKFKFVVGGLGVNFGEKQLPTGATIGTYFNRPLKTITVNGTISELCCFFQEPSMITDVYTTADTSMGSLGVRQYVMAAIPDEVEKTVAQIRDTVDNINSHLSAATAVARDFNRIFGDNKQILTTKTQQLIDFLLKYSSQREFANKKTKTYGLLVNVTVNGFRFQNICMTADSSIKSSNAIKASTNISLSFKEVDRRSNVRRAK